MSDRQVLASYGSAGDHSSGTKMVKTYEFHLPMHHIREEPGSPGQNARYEQPKSQASNYLVKPAKRAKKFDVRAKDDISSQMLDDGLTN